MEELDYQTIAKRLNIKLSAAKMRIKRAREAFIAVYTNLKKERAS
jgi:DNA-directed RNA polymerase specialized sigma24 family protein